MRRPILTAALLCQLAAAACGTGARPEFRDPHQPIAVRAGAEFDLALAANPTTGYQWMLADSAALGGFKLVGNAYRSSAPERNGAGGTERWTFRAPASGTGTIVLVYRRPWKTKPPADSARFVVTVR